MKTLISGGAIGADHLMTKDMPYKIRHLHTHLMKSPYGNECITMDEFHEALPVIALAANCLGRKNYHRSIKYFARDFQIAKQSEILIGIGYRHIRLKNYEGGTGWTFQFAKMLKRPIIMFNQITNMDEYYNCANIDLSQYSNIGVFGSRQLNENGLIAIERWRKTLIEFC